MEADKIFSIQIKAENKFLPITLSLVNKTCKKLGLDEKSIKELELVTEEACSNVIEHAFEPDEDAVYELSVYREPGQIRISIRDEGIPFDVMSISKGQDVGLGSIFMKAFTDKVSYFNLGLKGKKVDLIKFIPYENIEEIVQKGRKEKIPEEAVKLGPDDYVLRMMNPDDAVEMAKCIYHSYGYSYLWEFVYFPEKVKEYLVSELLRSCIILNKKNNIIGHFALMKQSKDSPVGETGMAVVDPRYRGNGLFKKMKLFLADYAKDQNMKGFYSEAVAVHPYSQKGNLSLGATETGIVLGHLPSNMFFKKIQKAVKSTRQAAVLFYMILKGNESSEVYIPHHHKSMVEKIYKNLGLNRILIKPVTATNSVKIKSKVETEVISHSMIGFIRILKYGNDIQDLVKLHLKELCMKKMEVVYLDIPLSEQETQLWCAQFELLGFFFAGIIPELINGDVLRLQYMNNIHIDLDKIVVASEFGSRLLDYVSNSYKNSI